MRVFKIGFRAAIGLAMLGSIYWQVSDRIAHNVFRPGEYFTYFTIDTGIAAGVVMLIAAWHAFQNRENLPEPRWLTLARFGLVTSDVIVGVVYNALLRDLPAAAADAGYVWPTPPNELLHVWAPILLVVEWVAFANHERLGWKAAFWTWAYPFAWLAFTLVRGSIAGWWPYFFIDPTDKGGVTGMLTYIFGIMAFLFVVASMVLPAQRLTQRVLVRA
ncbi:MAG: hypothetical protein RL605_809 [Actinomycetota bacterium]|jgi:hypothetical protein